jgi:hypothetical protein
MKSKIILSAATTLILTTGMAQTPNVWDNPSAWSQGLFATGTSGPKYSAQELSLDLFGSYINPESRLPKLFDSNIRHGFWGGGVGLNYFLLENVGVGADVNLSDHPGRIVDQALGDVILRLPVGDTGFAPYAIGSGGRGISPIYQWVYGGGVGLEYRFNPELGLFSDSRYLWADRRGDRLLIRAGFRIVF